MAAASLPRSAIHCLTQRNPLLAWQGVTCNSLKNSAEAVQGDRFPGVQGRLSAGRHFCSSRRASEQAVPLPGGAWDSGPGHAGVSEWPSVPLVWQPSSRPFCRLKMDACFYSWELGGPSVTRGARRKGEFCVPGGLDSSCPRPHLHPRTWVVTWDGPGWVPGSSHMFNPPCVLQVKGGGQWLP